MVVRRRKLWRDALVQKSTGTVLNIALIGGSTNPEVIGEQPLATKVNYFIGRNRAMWRTNVPTYARVRYRNVYPGIDLVYYGNQGRVEYDFDLASGADPTQIRRSASSRPPPVLVPVASSSPTCRATHKRSSSVDRESISSLLPPTRALLSAPAAALLTS
jgi:hypothetical protein